MRSPRLLRAALLAVPATLVVLPGAASGLEGGLPAECAPVDLTDEIAVDQRAAASDDVFVGRVDAATPTAGSGRVAYGVTVRRTWRGDVAKGQQAAVTVDWPVGAQPGVQQGASYLFFTRDTVDGIVADACGGAVLLPKGLTPKIAATLKAYLASVEPPPVPEPPPAPVAFHQPDEPLGDPPQIGRVLASGGAISLIGLLGLFLVSRLGRRRP
ncbi:hypothetical protein KVF89_01770 [Nocardioides carbamazepini]|uniref:hypothetical protein n=1 Tax=Nocardioides carbamazepini TaxID=2854259 RepID=UPI00214A68BE|nr:hypothetical protein [Nocardioides carbamazepini]MCR1781251.1 hypothetical protein [Nocardioides carbamazepini]